jgi:hypothetical protein
MNIVKNASKYMLRVLFVACTLLSTASLQGAHNHSNTIPKVPSIPDCNQPPPPPPPPCNILPPFSFWIDAQFLYWKTYQDGLEVGVSELVDIPTPTGSSSFFRENLKSLNFQWDPGFRIGIGQGFNVCCGWQTALYYTNMHSRAIRNHKNVLRARWKIQLDMVDAIVSRELWLDHCTNLSLFAGLRGAEIRQNFRVFEVDTLVAPQGVTLTQEAKKSHSKYYGLGPRLGIEAEWHTFCDVSLYGSVAVSALFGHLSAHFEEAGIAPDAIDACEVSRSQNFCQAITDAALGIRWKYCSCSGFKAEAELGFEHHQFYKQNKICDCGDLCFDGLVASLRFGF